MRQADYDDGYNEQYVADLMREMEAVREEAERKAHATGRAEAERETVEKIVEWLRREAAMYPDSLWGQDRVELADAIERGEHRTVKPNG